MTRLKPGYDRPDHSGLTITCYDYEIEAGGPRPHQP